MRDFASTYLPPSTYSGPKFANPREYVMIHVDGSFIGLYGVVGLGGVVQDNEETSILEFGKKVYTNDCLAAEILGILEATYIRPIGHDFGNLKYTVIVRLLLTLFSTRNIMIQYPICSTRADSGVGL